ncbi:unnamed protein product, partial [Ectocarpus fasciculatus]
AAVAANPGRRVEGSKTREESDRPPPWGGGSPSATSTSPETATATRSPARRPPVLQAKEVRPTSPPPQPQMRHQERWGKRGRGEKRGSSCSDDNSSSISRGSAESPSWSRGVPRKRRFPSKGWARAAETGEGERLPASPPGDSRGRAWQTSRRDEWPSGGVSGGGETGRESSSRRRNGSSSSSSSGSSEAVAPFCSSSAAAVSCYNRGPAEDLRPAADGSRPLSPKVVARVPRSRGEAEQEEEEEARGTSQRSRYVDHHHHLPERQASRGRGDVETTPPYTSTRPSSSGTGWTAAAAAAAAATRTTTRSPAVATAVGEAAVAQGVRRCRPPYPQQEVHDDMDHTAGRVVSVSPLKKAVTGDGVDEEGPDGRGEGGRGREKDGGGDSSPPRVQAWEPAVEASGIDLDVGSYAGRAAALRNPWAGSLHPKGQQPLAPKDLLLMLRPNDEGFFDCAGAEKRRGTREATQIEGGGAGGGGGWGGGGGVSAAPKM